MPETVAGLGVGVAVGFGVLVAAGVGVGPLLVAVAVAVPAADATTVAPGTGIMSTRPGRISVGSVISLASINAATVIGVEDRVGSLEVGKDADIVVLDGHPLDYRTVVEMVLIDGQVSYQRDV